MLKSEHGITHGFANLIAHKYLKSDAGSADATTDLVSEHIENGVGVPYGNMAMSYHQDMMECVFSQVMISDDLNKFLKERGR